MNMELEKKNNTKKPTPKINDKNNSEAEFEMNINDQELVQNGDDLWVNKLKAQLKYLNKNIALFSLALAALIAIISSLIKFEVYVFYCGMHDYWGISRSYINVTNENVFFSLFFNITLLIFWTGINYISYLILVSKTDSLSVRIFKVFILIIVTFLVFLVLILLFFNISIIELKKQDIPYLIVIGLVGPATLNLPGIWIAIGNLIKRKKDNSFQEKQTEKNIELPSMERTNIKLFIYMAIAVTICFSITIMATYGFGRYIAKTETTYKIIQDQYVIICETEDMYITSERIDNNSYDNYDYDREYYNFIKLSVNRNKQKVIEKDGVETEKMVFEKVEFR